VSEDFENNPFKALKNAKLKLKDAEDDAGTKKKRRNTYIPPKPAAPEAKPVADSLEAEDDLFRRAMGGSVAGQPAPRPRRHVQDNRPFGELLEEHEKKTKEAKETRHKAAQPKPTPAPTAPPLPEPDPEDASLFLGAMGDVQPMDGSTGRDVPKAVDTPPPTPPKNPEALTREHLRRLVSGEIKFQIEFTDEYQHGHVTGLDPKIFNQLSAGTYTVEAHQDLHGLNVDQAMLTTVEFIRRSYMMDKRHLLLVTGRGKNSPDGRGILRDEVQSWLTREPLRRVVLAYVTAQPRDGGPGALYVLLRKHKKSLGKVQWDRLPKEWTLED